MRRRGRLRGRYRRGAPPCSAWRSGRTTGYSASQVQGEGSAAAQSARRGRSGAPWYSMELWSPCRSVASSMCSCRRLAQSFVIDDLLRPHRKC